MASLLREPSRGTDGGDRRLGIPSHRTDAAQSRHRRTNLGLVRGTLAQRPTADGRQILDADMVDVKRVISRLTAAIVADGELAPLVTPLDTYERHRVDLAARLEGYLVDWLGLLSANVQQDGASPDYLSKTWKMVGSRRWLFLRTRSDPHPEARVRPAFHQENPHSIDQNCPVRVKRRGGCPPQVTSVPKVDDWTMLPSPTNSG